MFLSPMKTRIEPATFWYDLRWDALISLTIELPGLRWQREDYDVYLFVHVTYILLIQFIFIYGMTWIEKRLWAPDGNRTRNFLISGETLCIIAVLCRTYEPVQIVAFSPSSESWYSLMVRASHRRSEGCTHLFCQVLSKTFSI